MEKILSLDVSTKTGWALLTLNDKDVTLIEFGQNAPIKEPIGAYPGNFLEWAHQCYDAIITLINKFKPDTLVIEETTSNSKSAYSQKILEWIHYLVAKYIIESKIKAVYIMTGQWKSETEAKMTKDESKHNKMVKEYKKKHDTSIAYNQEGKRIGKITRKHVAIRRANEVFGKFLKTPLRKKDEDAAESLLLGYCYCLRRMKQ
jgi:hypothetical protein